MILQAWLTFPSCFASSSRPSFGRMIFSICVIVGSPLRWSNDRHWNRLRQCQIRLYLPHLRALTPTPYCPNSLLNSQHLGAQEGEVPLAPTPLPTRSSLLTPIFFEAGLFDPEKRALT